MTLNQLLLTPYYRGNKTLLAKELKINRGTLRKYLPDESNDFHFVLKVAGHYELFTNQSNKGDK